MYKRLSHLIKEFISEQRPQGSDSKWDKRLYTTCFFKYSDFGDVKPDEKFYGGKVEFDGQGKLFDEPVADTLEEAEAFLEDCMAAVVNNIEEVKEFLEEEGMDVDGMSMEELEEAAEVFALPSGQYLIVEG